MKWNSFLVRSRSHVSLLLIIFCHNFRPFLIVQCITSHSTVNRGPVLVCSKSYCIFFFYGKKLILHFKRLYRGSGFWVFINRYPIFIDNRHWKSRPDRKSGEKKWIPWFWFSLVIFHSVHTNSNVHMQFFVLKLRG